MPDPAIHTFFDERKEAWLKKKTKPSMDAEEIARLETECEQVFSGEHWLPSAAKRAGQISISTHPCTYSHPSARKNKNGYVSSIIASTPRSEDGYLRSGNVVVESDALGNAAALDVYKFLRLQMQDGETLLWHIQRDSPVAKALLSIQSEDYQILKDGFLAMMTMSGDIVTSSKIKQVFFPVESGYHLLSLLSNSGMIYELRGRIDRLRFSEELKALREAKYNNEYSEQGFKEMRDITTIGYGGTKPQNISVLNSQNGGKARLLLSVPPVLTKREVQFPTKDFFRSAIRYYDIQDGLRALHNIFHTDSDSIIPRRNLETGRDHRIEDILDAIILRMAVLRRISSEQFYEGSSQLPMYQKIWLCDAYVQRRQLEEAWLDELCEEIIRWMMQAYKKIISGSYTLGPAEREFFKQVVSTHREALR